MESALRYTKDFDIVFTKNISPLLTLELGQLIRVVCDSSSLYKQKLVKPKTAYGKLAAVKNNGIKKIREVGLLIEYLYSGTRGKAQFEWATSFRASEI